MPYLVIRDRVTGFGFVLIRISDYPYFEFRIVRIRTDYVEIYMSGACAPEYLPPPATMEHTHVDEYYYGGALNPISIDSSSEDEDEVDIDLVDTWTECLTGRKRPQTWCWGYGQLVQDDAEEGMEYGLDYGETRDGLCAVHKRRENRPIWCSCTASYNWNNGIWLHHECDACIPEKLTLISNIFADVPDAAKIVMEKYMNLDFE